MSAPLHRGEGRSFRLWSLLRTGLAYGLTSVTSTSRTVTPPDEFRAVAFTVAFVPRVLPDAVSTAPFAQADEFPP